MIRSVIVLGGGSAGFLAALTLKTKLPQLNIMVIHSKDIGIIGVGEATTVALPKLLHGYLSFDPGDFYRRVETTWKLGIRFLWGPRPYFDYTFGFQLDWKWANLGKFNGFYCDDDFSYVDTQSALMSHNKAFVRRPDGSPMVGINNYAYHIENQKFVEFLHQKALERGVTVRDETVDEVLQDDAGIAGLRVASGVVRAADLYVDCSGFRSTLLGKTLGEPYTSFKSSLYNDRAVTGGWARGSDEPVKPYTTAESMDHGWCWQIDHLDRINRGYVYSTDFVSDSEAEAEFRRKNPEVTSTRLVRFSTGRYHRSWVKNVVGIGNSAGFVEPLESTGLAVICDESRLLAEALSDADCHPTPSLMAAYNDIFAREWDAIRFFLAIHFKYNTRFDTPYWRACRADIDIGSAAAVVDFYRENGPTPYAKTTVLGTNDIFGMEGYLCLLVGQKVPYNRAHKPTPQERLLWRGIQAENRVKALTAVDVADAYQAVSAPSWQWNTDVFRV
ncbi:tryptophan halogenase family protein [Fimbriiglobus ruber]|uniref:Tryptophan halogenase n=1 Tax=Fimbriiglobus ruber TaxID=1908690 RepID=A0A225DMX6_9BACT|nr:tryptophan halogenase family protein [Fimbriiglobus ruber]OWK39908.1 Tryptophan halogenase [Fimbriiglobus ruber]